VGTIASEVLFDRPDMLKETTSQALNRFNSDPRHYQLLFLLLFLITGLFWLDWHLQPLQIPFTFLTAILTQWLAIRAFNIPLNSLKSAIITSFSLCLLFRSDSLHVIVLAAFLSIAFKFVFRIQNRHFINPANAGICCTILLTGDGWISPGQWGSGQIWLLLIGILGWIIVSKAARIGLAAGFLAGYIGGLFVRMILWQDWPLDALTHVFTSGSLLLFSFFMITDPASTPIRKEMRILWSILVGLLAFYLQAFHWVNGAPIWALFMLSPLIPIMNNGKEILHRLKGISLCTFLPLTNRFQKQP